MKYIDSEKLIAEIERQQRRLTLLSNTEQVDLRRDCALQNGVYNSILATISSLQQEQPDKYETALEKARECMPNVNQGGHAMLIGIFPELGEGLDPRYGGRKQEQPEVDIDDEIDKFMFAPFQNFERVSRHCLVDMGDGKEWVPVNDWKITTYERADAHFLRKFARHFYELGLKARKEDGGC